MLSATDYQTLKQIYDSELNTDKSTFRSSNDEPTPMACVEEMVNALPSSFWSATEPRRILDPCCGNGNFGLYLLHKAQTHQTRVELTCNDINEERLANVGKYLPLAKITARDYLADGGFHKGYDLIVANPPYARLMADGSRASKNHSLVGDFLRKSLSLLNQGGFLLFIVPDNWMSFSDRNTLIRDLTALQFHKLNIHLCKKYFKKVGSSFTWFLLENVQYSRGFEVECLWKGQVFASVVESQVRSFIPLLWTSIVQSIVRKTIDADNPKYPVETSSHLHRFTRRDWIVNARDDAHPYRLIHTPKQTCYSSVPHKFQEGVKVFISSTDAYQVFVDDCGMTQSILFIRVGADAGDTEDAGGREAHRREADRKEAERIAKRLNHPLYRFLNNICRYGNFNNIRVIQRFPVCFTDDPMEEFGLSAEEKEFISKNGI